MLQAFHTESRFAETFLTAVLARSVNLEEDLCDQIFNHSEKRLARVLLNSLASARTINWPISEFRK